jgi:hypothetical protein
MIDKRVEQLLADIAQSHPSHHQLLQAVRKLILKLGSDVREEVKYGGILFACEQPFCGLFAYTQHVTLELGEGAHLPDDFQVLEGKGKQRRHIKLLSPADIQDKHVEHYLALAVARGRQSTQ